MKLYVLIDNNTIIDSYYKGEPALSFYIETQNCKVLFDTGYSDLFLENAQKMNLPIQDIDYIVLSHGHNDHTLGLKYLLNFKFNKRVKIIGHPLVFNKKIDVDGSDIGSYLSIEDLNQKFELLLSEKPVKINKNLTFLGEIPRILDKETTAIGDIIIDGKAYPDHLLDDSALVFEKESKITIITGCSHSGLINIIDYAQKITDCNEINSIIGGFHLLDNELNNNEKIVKHLKLQTINKLYPCHCTGLKAKCSLMQHFNVYDVGVGLIIDN